MADLFNLQASLTLDTSEYDDALDEAVEASDDLVDALTGVDDASNDTDNAMDAVADAFEYAGESAENSSLATKLLTKAFGDNAVVADVLSGKLDELDFDAIAETIVDAVEAVGKFINEMTQLGDAVDKGSQKIMFSADAYQKWSYIAQLSGTNIETIRGAM